MFSRLLVGILVVAALAAAPASLSPTSAATPFVFQTEMYGSNQVPPVDSSSWGFFRFFFNDDRSEADVTIDVKGMSGPNVIGADIHRGEPGSNGPVVVHVSDGGFIVEQRHVSFTPEELQQMAAGEYYISLKTINHPDGELRGQIQVPAGFLPASVAPATPTPATPPSNGGIRPPNTGDGGLAAGKFLRSIPSRSHK